LRECEALDKGSSDSVENTSGRREDREKLEKPRSGGSRGRKKLKRWVVKRKELRRRDSKKLNRELLKLKRRLARLLRSFRTLTLRKGDSSLVRETL
jgi:hypothetical protein